MRVPVSVATPGLFLLLLTVLSSACSNCSVRRDLLQGPALVRMSGIPLFSDEYIANETALVSTSSIKAIKLHPTHPLMLIEGQDFTRGERGVPNRRVCTDRYKTVKQGIERSAAVGIGVSRLLPNLSVAFSDHELVVIEDSDAPYFKLLYVLCMDVAANPTNEYNWRAFLIVKNLLLNSVREGHGSVTMDTMMEVVDRIDRRLQKIEEQQGRTDELYARLDAIETRLRGLQRLEEHVTITRVELDKIPKILTYLKAIEAELRKPHQTQSAPQTTSATLVEIRSWLEGFAGYHGRSPRKTPPFPVKDGERILEKYNKVVLAARRKSRGLDRRIRHLKEELDKAANEQLQSFAVILLFQACEVVDKRRCQELLVFLRKASARVSGVPAHLISELLTLRNSNP